MKTRIVALLALLVMPFVLASCGAMGLVSKVGEAIEVAERFRRAFEEHQWRRHPELVLTASFGVADLTSMPISTTPAELLALADAALYAAKRGGRNRVSSNSLPLAA